MCCPIKNIEGPQTVFTSLTVQEQISIADGTVTDPSLTFINDVDTGLYLPSAGNLALAVGGVQQMNVSTTLITDELPVVIDVTGTEALLVRKNADGGDVFMVDSTNSQAKLADGTVSLPSVGFINDVDTGLYLPSAGNLALAVGGVQQMNVSTSLITGELPLVIDVTGTEALLVRKNADGGDVFMVDSTNSQAKLADGTVSLPSVGFINDVDTGLYLPSAGNLALAVGGVQQMNVSTTLITGELPVVIDSTNTEALLVRKNADGGDVFNVNTSSNIITMNAIYRNPTYQSRFIVYADLASGTMTTDTFYRLIGSGTTPGAGQLNVWGSPSYNTAFAWTSSTGQLSVSYVGVYTFSYQIQCSGYTGTFQQSYLHRKNSGGTTVAVYIWDTRNTNTTVNVSSGSSTFYVDSIDDTFEIEIDASYSAGTATVGTNNTYFSCVQIC